jgi:hypothetical protein
MRAAGSDATTKETEARYRILMLYLLNFALRAQIKKFQDLNNSSARL